MNTIKDFSGFDLRNYVALRYATDEATGEPTLSFALDNQANADDCARGSYQEGIVYGTESLSGGTLTGKAAYYGGRYRESRENLLSRLTAAGVIFEVATFRGAYPGGGRINRTVLIFG